ncbi:MAG: pentapeptide repeat-containing protein [Pararhodobacter sp.]|nr:pentapeptide repeat-containing protein [Pararhodobacter sp.]
MDKNGTDDFLVELSGRRFSLGFSVFFFAFGIAAGFLLAFAGLGFLEDSAGLIASVFLIALLVIVLAGIIVFLMRHTLMEKVFGIAEAQMEMFAGPLTGVAEGAAARDPDRAINSARRFLQLALARYAWLATRRWIMTSLTALIAAMAALAGTALLFKQNALLGEQNLLFTQHSALLAEQNERLSQQSGLLLQQNELLSQDIELAEAARNAALIGEVIAIAAALGETANVVMQQDESLQAGGSSSALAGAGLDPANDLERSLIFRIIATSQALRPYRFLDLGVSQMEPDDILIAAMERRRHDLPGTFSAMTAQTGWQERAGPAPLVDRPASPERGQLLRAMVENGLRRTDLLSWYGLNLSHAHAPGINLTNVSLQLAHLDFADFSGGDVAGTDFAGAALNMARFRAAQLLRSRFASPEAGTLNLPLGPDETRWSFTRLSGADFSRALIRQSDFSRVHALAASFDGAFLDEVDFSGAALSAATFRGAVLISPRFDGAELRSIDLDGAYLFGDDPLAELERIAAPESFYPGRYRAEPVGYAEAVGATPWDVMDAAALQARVGGAQAWRIERISAFE